MFRWPILIGLCLTAGCIHYQPVTLSPAQSAAGLQARALDDPTLKRFIEVNLGREFTAWPPKAWAFEQLALVAVFFQPDLEVARAQWRVSEAEVITAGGRPNPTVGVMPGYNFNAAGGVSPWAPALTVDWPIETAGKRGHRVVRAQHLAVSARQNFAAAVWRVRASLRLALVELHDAARRQELLQQQQLVQRQLRDLLEQRADAGTIARFEVTPARLALQKLQGDLLDAGKREAEALVKVAAALGVPVSALTQHRFRFDGNFGGFDGLTTDEARRLALTSRADLAGALADYEAAQSALQLEIAKQYPDVHLGTGYQWDQGDSKWQLGLAIEIPVVNRNTGPIRAAQARREEAAARFVALQAKVLGDIDRALTALQTSTARGKTGDEILATLRLRRRDIAAQVEAGAGDRLDLLTADAEVALASLQRWEAEASILQAAGVLEDALQRPLRVVERQSATSRLPGPEKQP